MAISLARDIAIGRLAYEETMIRLGQDNNLCEPLPI